MDQSTRRIIGFAEQPGAVDGPALCRMFNQITASAPTLPQHLSSDYDPLFEFHRWKTNLRILAVSEIKTVPHVPLSHPFVERVIGTVRRELLNHVSFWGARDLERKLWHFRDYYNHGRVHASLKGVTSICSTDRNVDRSQRLSMAISLSRVVSAACGRVRLNSPHTHWSY